MKLTFKIISSTVKVFYMASVSTQIEVLVLKLGLEKCGIDAFQILTALRTKWFLFGSDWCILFLQIELFEPNHSLTTWSTVDAMLWVFSRWWVCEYTFFSLHPALLTMTHTNVVLIKLHFELELPFLLVLFLVDVSCFSGVYSELQRDSHDRKQSVRWSRNVLRFS